MVTHQINGDVGAHIVVSITHSRLLYATKKISMHRRARLCLLVRCVALTT